MIINGMRPIHPGELLREEFLEPLGITPAALARALHVSAPRVNAIGRERRGVTADMALRMGRYFATSPTVLDEAAKRVRPVHDHGGQWRSHSA